MKTEDPIVKNWEDIEKIFSFLRKRLDGTTKTLAAYQRDYILNHNQYRQDSIVTDEIAYELLYELQLIAEGKLECPNFATPFDDLSKKDFNQKIVLK